MASYSGEGKGEVHHLEVMRSAGAVEKVNLNSNTSGRIQNPLAHLSPAQLSSDVDAFADQHQLDDIRDLLHKGAKVAANPAEFENVEGLEPSEIVALRREVTHKWSHPRKLYFTIILCSIGAAVQGWDQTGSVIPGPSKPFSCTNSVEWSESFIPRPIRYRLWQ